MLSFISETEEIEDSVTIESSVTSLCYKTSHLPLINEEPTQPISNSDLSHRTSTILRSGSSSNVYYRIDLSIVTIGYSFLQRHHKPSLNITESPVFLRTIDRPKWKSRRSWFSIRTNQVKGRWWKIIGLPFRNNKISTIFQCILLIRSFKDHRMPTMSRSWLRQQLEFRRTFGHLEKTKTASQHQRRHVGWERLAGSRNKRR